MVKLVRNKGCVRGGNRGSLCRCVAVSLCRCVAVRCLLAWTGLAGAMFCARRDGRRVSYGFHDNGVDRVDPILRARHRFSGARSAQALADLNRATLWVVGVAYGVRMKV